MNERSNTASKRRYVEIDDVFIPDSFYGDPDEYAENVCLNNANTVEVEGLFCSLIDVTEKPFSASKDITESGFTGLSRSNFHLITTFLSITDLSRLSRVNQSVYRELKNDAYWCSRYFKAFGKSKYVVNLTVSFLTAQYML